MRAPEAKKAILGKSSNTTKLLSQDIFAQMEMPLAQLRAFALLLNSLSPIKI